MDYFEWYLDTRVNSGQQEGLLYTGYSVDELAMSLDTFTRVTGEKGLFGHKFFSQMLLNWLTYFGNPANGTTVNYSDAEYTAYFFVTASILSNNFDHGLAGYYLTHAKPRSTSLREFIYFNKDFKVTPPTNLPTSKLMDQIGWGALRTGWTKEDSLFSMIANNSTLGHNHYDQNSFQLAANGSFIAKDPGYADFTEGSSENLYTMKYGHNTITVDGNAQSVKGTGALTAKMMAPQLSHIVGSAAGAYGSALSKFDRHAMLINHKNAPYYVLLDDLSSSVSRTYGFTLNPGYFNSLSVDGTEVGSVSQTEGKSIKLETDSINLNANFISKEGLTIKAGNYLDTVHQLINVENKAKATDYKLMTVLSTENNKGQNIYFTNIMNSAITSGGEEFKKASALGRDVVFYRGAKEGDSICFDFTVEKADQYEIVLNMPLLNIYGKYQVYIDGKAIGSAIDGYASALDMAKFNLGKTELSKGLHTVKFECVGKNDNATKYCLGIYSLSLTGSNESSSQQSTVSVLEQYASDNMIGALIGYGENQKDLIAFKNGTDAMNENNVVSDASSIGIYGLNSNSLEGYSITEGAGLTFNGKEYVKVIDSSATIYVDLLNNAEIYSNSANAATVKIYVGNSDYLNNSGEIVSKDGYITLEIPAGEATATFTKKTVTPPINPDDSDNNNNDNQQDNDDSSSKDDQTSDNNEGSELPTTNDHRIPLHTMMVLLTLSGVVVAMVYKQQENK